MKAKIHPKVNEEVEVICSCGNKFTTISTKDKIEVEICSACHPFYTGKSKLVDTAGVVDKFKSRLSKTQNIKSSKKSKKKKDKDSKKKQDTKKKTLKDLKK